MGEEPAPGREPSRKRGATEQPSEQLDWSQLEPFEEGRAGELPNDDTALFGDFASQLLDGRRRDVCVGLILRASTCLGTGQGAEVHCTFPALGRKAMSPGPLCWAMLYSSLASLKQPFFCKLR